MIHLMEEVQSFIDIHIQDLTNRLPSPSDGENFRFIPLSLTELTRNIGVRQKLQFNLFVAVPITSRTGTFFRIKAEMRVRKAQILRFGRSCIEQSDFVKDAHKSCRAASRSFPNARLVYIDCIFDLFVSGDFFNSDILVKFLQCEVFKMCIFFSSHHGSSQDFFPAQTLFQKLKSDITLNEFLLIIEESIQCRVHQGRFPGSRRSSDYCKTSEIQLNINVLEIIFTCVFDLHSVVAWTVLKINFHFLFSCNVVGS